jgi:hypothetical protein
VIISQTPVLNDVRDITLAKNGSVALVSYENKVRHARRTSFYLIEGKALAC